MWASSPNDAWFTTNAGTVVHYNGAGFTETVPAPFMGKFNTHLVSIWGSGPTDVWASGSIANNSAILHFDGTTWSQVADDSALAGNFSLDAVVAISRTSAYTTGHPLLDVEHWDGKAWTADTSGSLNLANPLIALWGVTDSRILGIEPPAVAGGNAKLWTFTGSTWVTDNRISAPMFSVGGSGNSDIWVGSNKNVYHFDGNAWSAAMALPASTVLGNIVSVSSSSGSDAWAVGIAGDTYHYDGTSWKAVNIGISTDNQPRFSVYSQSPHLTWIAGQGILSARK